MKRLSPIEIRRIWYSLPFDGYTKIIAFGNAITDKLLETPPDRNRIHLQDLNLPALWYGALRRAGYEFVDEVEGMRRADLMTLKHVGERGAAVILEAIRTAYDNRLIS